MSAEKRGESVCAHTPVRELSKKSVRLILNDTPFSFAPIPTGTLKAYFSIPLVYFSCSVMNHKANLFILWHFFLLQYRF